MAEITDLDGRGAALRLRGYLAQGLLEHFARLAALQQMAFVQDDGRHRVDAVLVIETFAFAYFLGVFIAGQHCRRAQTVETD